MNKLRSLWQCQVYRYAKSSQHGSESGGSSSGVSASKLWKTFLKIKKLHITDCDSLEKILDLEDSFDTNGSYNKNCHDAELREVKLKNLMQIENIWGRDDSGEREILFRYLQIVSLCKCPRIESVFPASMANDLLRLQSLEVMLCDGIKHLIGEENSLRGNDPLRLQSLDVMLCDGIKHLIEEENPLRGNNAHEFFFPDVEVLELRKLQKLVSFYGGPHCSEWPSLERLTVLECNNFKIFGSECETSQASNQASLDLQPLFSVKKDSFCRLSTLELSQNQMMKQIWAGSFPLQLFRKLEVLKLTSSSEEPVILPLNFLHWSPHLKSLHVDNPHFPEDVNKTLKPKGLLHRHNKQLVTKRSLHKMELNLIPQMTDLKEALNKLFSESSYSLGWLTSLKVSNCHHLSYLFTYSMMRSLGCLIRLIIANCQSMEVVVASEGNTEGEVILDKLDCLQLDSLDGLTSFCEGNYKFQFPSLREVTVQGCSKMMMFTCGKTISPNLTKVKLKGRKVFLHDEHDLNKIITEN